jgi:hypothetical protein
VTEIHYHPLAPEEGSPWESDEFEFLEIENTGLESVDLSGYAIAGGVRFEFAAGAVPSLASGEVVVVVRNLAAFASRYDLGAILVAGEYAGRLSNLGETVRLLGVAGESVLEIPYEDAWQAVTDGDGPSLVAVDGHERRERWGLAESWRASGSVHGTPGRRESDAGDGWQLPADLSQDARVDISDAIALLRYLFLGATAPLPCGDGTLEAEGNLRLLDSNGDGRTNLSDAVALLGYLFGGDAPPALGTECVPIRTCPDACVRF